MVRRFKELTMYRDVFSLCNSSRNITLNKHLDLKKKKKQRKGLTLIISKTCMWGFVFFLNLEGGTKVLMLVSKFTTRNGTVCIAALYLSHMR